MKIAFETEVLKEIYEKLKEHNIGFEINMAEEEILVEGFSKSGVAALKEAPNGDVYAYTRYDQVTEMRSFEDLVALNFEWFDSYRDRKPFTEPDISWADVLIEYGYLKQVEEKKVRYINAQ